MWGEDEIDDVLEKLKVDDALKELRENQEVILKNQQAIKNSLSAIEGLLHKRLHKRAKEVAALPLVSAESAPSYSGSMSQTSSLEESPATLVSSTPIPGPFPSNTTLPSEVMSPPSSSVSPDCANSNGVAQMGEISQCSSVSRAENVSPSNGGNEEDVSAENLSSSFATYNGPIPRDLINVAAASSGNCKTFVFKLMDGMFHKKELARSSFSGGVRKYRGVMTVKEALSPNRMKNIFKAAKQRYPTEFAEVSTSPEFREAINMKCCKTMFKPKD